MQVNLKLDRKILDNKYIILQNINTKFSITNYLTIFVVEDEFSFNIFEKELSIILSDLIGEKYYVEEYGDHYIISNKEDGVDYIIANYDLGVVYC